MCTEKPPHNYAPILYTRYQEVFETYINNVVLPALDGTATEDAFLLELIRRWNNHETFTRFMSKFFEYLGRHFIKRFQLPDLVVRKYRRCEK
jgi:hypothetical protein